MAISQIRMGWSLCVGVSEVHVVRNMHEDLCQKDTLHPQKQAETWHKIEMKKINKYRKTSDF